jgi:hypothetical protein
MTVEDGTSDAEAGSGSAALTVFSTEFCARFLAGAMGENFMISQLRTVSEE